MATLEGVVAVALDGSAGRTSPDPGSLRAALERVADLVAAVRDRCGGLLTGPQKPGSAS